MTPTKDDKLINPQKYHFLLPIKGAWNIASDDIIDSSMQCLTNWGTIPSDPSRFAEIAQRMRFRIDIENQVLKGRFQITLN